MIIIGINVILSKMNLIIEFMVVILTSQIKKKGNCVMKCCISFQKLKIILRKVASFFLRLVLLLENMKNILIQDLMHLMIKIMKRQLYYGGRL